MICSLPLLAFLGAPTTGPAAPPPAPTLMAPVPLGDHITLDGYVQAAFVVRRDTEFNPDDNDGFTLPQVRLAMRGHRQVSDQLVARLLIDGQLASGTFSLLDVRARLEWLDGHLGLDAGQFKVPFALVETEPTATRQFAVDSPARRLSYARDRGARLWGNWTLNGAFFAADFGVFNGEGTNVENIDDSYLYAGHLEVHPLGRVSRGEADLDNSPFGFAIEGSAAWNPKVARKNLGFGDVGADELRWAAAALMKFRGISFRGELIVGDLQSDVVDYGRYAAYAQAGYVLPFEFIPKLEIVARWTQMDINDREDGYATESGRQIYRVSDNSEVRFIDLGLNAYFLDHRVRANLMYRLTDFLEGPKTDTNGDPLIGDAVFALLQIGWL